VLLGKEMIEQRSLARAEEAGEDGHGHWFFLRHAAILSRFIEREGEKFAASRRHSRGKPRKRLGAALWPEIR
jgi:hypothetical protein